MRLSPRPAAPAPRPFRAVPPPEPVRRCPHGRLSRLLAAMLPPMLIITKSHMRPWASASFVGARHIFHCRIAEDAGSAALTADLAASLQEQASACEWPLPRDFVADVAVEAAAVGETGDGTALIVEILTVEV